MWLGAVLLESSVPCSRAMDVSPDSVRRVTEGNRNYDTSPSRRLDVVPLPPHAAGRSPPPLRCTLTPPRDSCFTKAGGSSENNEVSVPSKHADRAGGDRHLLDARAREMMRHGFHGGSPGEILCSSTQGHPPGAKLPMESDSIHFHLPGQGPIAMKTRSQN